MMVPKLIYDVNYQNIEYGRFSQFVYSSFVPHEAPLDTLHFKLGQESNPFDIGIWITIAVNRCVLELIIEMDCSSSVNPLVLPMILLYTGYRMLVTLKLNNTILLDDSYMPSFSTLKSLSLLSVKYPGDEFVKRLLSNCHVLEDLVVERCLHDNVTIFTVRVPSLKSLVLRASEERDLDNEDGFVIDYPYYEILGTS